MGTFTWLGGDIGNPNDWQSGGSAGTEPGSTDLAVFPSGGNVSGSANVGVANFTGGFVLSGANLSAGNETVSAGASIVQENGINAIVSSANSLNVLGSYTLSGGTLSGPTAAEFVAGSFEQFGGAHTIGHLQISGATYTLKSGTLAVVSGFDGLEFVGLNASGGFIQSGGTQTVAQALEIGYQASGSYTQTGGLLSMPLSGASPTGEYIGENSGGVGSFIQTGGTNQVADRVVIGTTNGAGDGNGTYTLGGSGKLIVNTLFVGSENGCSGTFNFNRSNGDNASLTISGADTAFPGLIVGGDGIGFFIQGGVFGTSLDNGGTVSASSVQIGRHFDGNGTYTLSTGILSVSGYETIGGAGVGTMNVLFGSNTVGGDLYIASGTEPNPNAPGGTSHGDGIYNLSGGTLTVSNAVTLGGAADTLGTLNIGSGTRVPATMTVSAAGGATALTVGSGGSGEFNLFSGTVTLRGLSSGIPVLDIGMSSGGDGSAVISGGTLTISGSGGTVGPVVVGDSGSGAYQQVGGSVTFGGDLLVGAAGLGQGGSVSLDGGSLNISGGIVIARDENSFGTFNYNTSQGAAAKLTLALSSTVVVGKDGAGTFNQGGGSIIASGLDLGADSGGHGVFNLSGGKLTVTSGEAIVGDNGFGSFVHNGATATSADFGGGLDIGAHDGSGTYDFSAGMLTVGVAGQPSTSMTVGDSGLGNFIQTSGTGVFNGGLTVGGPAGGTGHFTLSSGTDTINGNTLVGATVSGTYQQSGGKATFAGNLTVASAFTASGSFALDGDASAVVQGEIDLGVGPTTSAAFDFNSNGGSATLTGPGGEGPNFKVGLGGEASLNVGGGVLKGDNVAVGTEAVGSGVVNVFGGGAFSMTTLSVGSFDSGNSANGGLGTLQVYVGGYVSVAKTLALNDSASIDSSLKETLSGGISLSGGSLEVGGDKGGLAANTLQIDAGGVLSGHGLIQGGNHFSVTIADGGKLEAQNGLLVISGGVSGEGTVQIDNDATVEIAGPVDGSVTVNFQSGGTGTLILDNPGSFVGKVTGLTDGDQIILTSTGSGTSPQPSEVVAATIGNLPLMANFSAQVLQVSEGSDASHINNSFFFTVRGPANDPILTGQSSELPHFFAVTSAGSGASNYTTLTLSSGSPIAQALGVTQSGSALGNGGSFTGAGIKIGIISDSFNALGGEQADINDGLLPSKSNIIDLTSGVKLANVPGFTPDDEGRAMAEIVHAIAPDATIVFQSPLAEPQANTGDYLGAIAQAVKNLQAQGVQIIVDDLAVPGEPNSGGALNSAILNAVASGITYFSAAGNDRSALPIYGHRDNPAVVTVAADNYLASSDPPALIAPYLQTATEPFSSVGDTNSGKPNITAPDGGPTGLGFGTNLDPFFGTSAAAPAAAAVAALMMQANPQLKTQSFKLETMLPQYAIPISGETSAMDGAGLLNGFAAVSAAAGSRTDFFDPSGGSGPTLLTAAVSQPFGDVVTATLVQFQLTFNEAIIVTGAPTFTLNDGARAIYDAKASEPSNAVLVFDSTVSSTQHTGDLEITGFVAGSGKIADSSGNVPVLSGMFNSPTGLSVNSPVTVTSVTSDKSGQEVSSGSTAHISMTFNAPVSVTSGASGGLTLALDDGGTAFYDSAASTATTLVFDYVVSGGQQTPDLTVEAVDLASGTTVQSGGFDANTSAAIGAATGVQVGAGFVTDVVPSQFGEADPGTSVTLTIDFSQAVSINTSGGSPTLTLNNGGTAFYDAALSSAGGGALVFDYTVSSGQSTPDLEIAAVHSGGAVITDAHNVALDFSEALSAPLGLAIDSPLKVASITTPTLVFADTGKTVNLDVSMSEAVTIDTIDTAGVLPTLTLNDSGTATYDTKASDLSAGLLVFDYNVGSHGSTTDLKVTAFNLNDAGIVDSGGNVLDVSAGFPFDIGIGINSFDSWKAGASGGWSTTSDWSAGVPTPTTQATVLGGGVVSTTASEAVGSIATAKGAALHIGSGIFTATSGTGIGINGGQIVIGDGATLALAGTFVNSGSVTVSGVANPTELEIAGTALVLSGGGKLALSDSADNTIVTNGATATLTNVNNIISGAGTIGNADLTLVNAGVVDGDALANTLTLSAAVINSGILEGTTAEGLVIGAAVTNSKTIEALGSGAALVIAKVAVTDTHSGVILASGTGAHVDLDSSTVSGGMVEAIAGGELRLSGAAIGSGTLVETASGGTAILSGAISNSGALFASGIHSLIDLVSGATVTGGGSVEVGNGAVQIAGAGSEAVNFLSNGAGGLLLNGATSYTGNVSNFGAGISAHSDHSEYIELTAVTYSSGVVSETYSGGTSGGVLKVTSGATTVATISMIGSYVTSDFKLAAGSGGSGTVITDPATVHSANITLFGSYIAGSFVTAGGQGGSAISNTAQGEQPMLTHPHA